MDMRYLYKVRVLPGLEYECEGGADPCFNVGDEVILRCDRFQDIGMVVSRSDHDGRPPEEVAEDSAGADGDRYRSRKVEGAHRPLVQRLAAPEDHLRAQENNAQADQHLRVAADIAARHGLDMGMVNAHCTFDRRLVVFQFVADGRVDFRQLLRELSDTLRMRVELRQIGVRDEAAILGGIADCGRSFCCSGHLQGFVSINIKMAKVQNLSLNPANISGACGRLKCCLAYEYEGYREIADEQKRQAREARAQAAAAAGEGAAAPGSSGCGGCGCAPDPAGNRPRPCRDRRPPAGEPPPPGGATGRRNEGPRPPRQR